MDEELALVAPSDRASGLTCLALGSMHRPRSSVGSDFDAPAFLGRNDVYVSLCHGGPVPARGCPQTTKAALLLEPSSRAHSHPDRDVEAAHGFASGGAGNTRSMRELPEDLAAMPPRELAEQRALRDDRLAPLFRRWPALSRHELGQLRTMYAERLAIARHLGRRRVRGFTFRARAK